MVFFLGQNDKFFRRGSVGSGANWKLVDQSAVLIEPKALLGEVDQNKFGQVGNISNPFGKDLRPYGEIERDIDEGCVRTQIPCAAKLRHELHPVYEGDSLAVELERSIKIFHKATKIAD